METENSSSLECSHHACVLCKSLQCTFVHNFVKTLRNILTYLCQAFFFFYYFFFLCRIKKYGFLITVIQSGIYFIIIVLFCKTIFLVVFCFVSFLIKVAN